MSRCGSNMDIDQVGGEALLMLSKMAGQSSSIASVSTQQSASTTAGNGQQQPVRKHVLNVVAVVQHITALEERVRQLENIVNNNLSSHMRSATASAPVSAATSPTELQSPKMPVGLTSIRFNCPDAMPKSLVSPTIAEHGMSHPQSPRSTSITSIPQQFLMGGAQHHPNQVSSPPAQNMWPQHPGMVLKDATVKDVQRNILDRVCQPLLERCYDPDKTQLLDLVDELEKGHFYHIDRRTLMSAVRRWFRKRREEMGARVFMLCRSGELLNVPSDKIREFLRGLKDDYELLDRFRSRAGIEVKDLAQARGFVYEKIDSFFRRKMVQQSP